MIDESDVSLEKTLFFNIQSEVIKKTFQDRRINLHPCLTHQDARFMITQIINTTFESTPSKDRVVSFSDSVTLHQLDIYNTVANLSQKLNFRINNPFERFDDGKLKAFGIQPKGKLDLPKEQYVRLQQEWLEQLRTTLLSDILIIGANAISATGEIVSTDGAGNRVAGMIFGPRKVIVVAGRNKIVPTIEEAVARNRNIAAPLNYLRHNEKHHNRYDTPCLSVGRCVSCNHPRKACLNTVIISGAVEANKDRIHLVLVNDDLGL